MKWLILTLLIISSVQAAYEFPDEAFDISDEELNPSDLEVLRTRKEKYQRDESMVDPINSLTGLRDMRRYTGFDRTKLSASLHLNGHYEQLARLVGGEFSWLKRRENWSKAWWGFTLRTHRTQWGQITQNRSTGGEAVDQRPKDASQQLNSFGLGGAYRFKLFLDFFETKDVFETVQVFATYNTLADSFSKLNYQGYGLTTDYMLHKRTRTSFFYGGKFSYNLAYVQAKKSRNLSLGWYTFALETGFFY
jgi:hypothetical protein